MAMTRDRELKQEQNRSVRYNSRNPLLTFTYGHALDEFEAEWFVHRLVALKNSRNGVPF